MTQHYPVMMTEVMDGLETKPDGCYWDGTFGGGGHSGRILSLLNDSGQLYGTDRDALAEANARTYADDSRFTFIRGSLLEVIDRVPNQLAGFLWDLGCSTFQLRDPDRGFSFKDEGPLDMRMDRDQPTTAADIVNQTPETQLADLIYKYGEERLSRRIAHAIVERRREARFTQTRELAELCRRCYPNRRHHRIDPATRTFQALRIAVNDELGQIERGLPMALEKLAPGGRAVVISFHSLEDRIVKHCFRDHAKAGGYRILTKKPLVPSDSETAENPPSRSAKLRILERTTGAAP